MFIYLAQTGIWVLLYNSCFTRLILSWYQQASVNQIFAGNKPRYITIKVRRKMNKETGFYLQKLLSSY